MQPVESKAALAIGWKTPEAKSVLICSDLFTSQEGCCRDCHERNYSLVIYPWSIYSTGFRDKVPDLGMGIRAEVCCARFHLVRELDREFWIRLYAKKQGWSQADGEKLAKSTKENYWKVWNEICSRNYDGPKPAAPRPRTPRKAVSKPSVCPDCGDKWDGYSCDNCGYEG